MAQCFLQRFSSKIISKVPEIVCENETRVALITNNSNKWSISADILTSEIVGGQMWLVVGTKRLETWIAFNQSGANRYLEYTCTTIRGKLQDNPSPNTLLNLKLEYDNGTLTYSIGNVVKATINQQIDVTNSFIWSGGPAKTTISNLKYTGLKIISFI